MIKILPVKLDVLKEFKSTRLRALQDTPLAFGSTYARESQFTDDDWNARLARADGVRGVNFLAWDEVEPARREPCGIVAGFFEDEKPTDVHLVSMWVAPTHRRQGVGQLLVNEVIGWAQSRGAERVRLLVTDINVGAIKFYDQLGFEKSGKVEPYPNDPKLNEFEMICELGQFNRKTANA
ncbi:MAG TPA: GNAT family N-acetyltransferase, partial [Tepidisphaeraceae bacterium]|nr:GNAT family N-acetyltransferase [Tepidisphaeraceae bacterium]